MSEAEFAELAEWFATHDAELMKAGSLETKDGRRVWCANVRYSLAHGPRAIGAGRVAEKACQLKARYTEITECHLCDMCASTKPAS